MADNEGKYRVQEQRKYHYGKPLPRHGSPRDRGSADAVPLR